MILQKEGEVKGIVLTFDGNANESAMPTVILEPDCKAEARSCHCLLSNARILFYWCLSKDLTRYFMLKLTETIFLFKVTWPYQPEQSGPNSSLWPLLEAHGRVW